MSKSIVWNLGEQQTFTATEIGDKLTINGYKENDFVATLTEAGQLVLTDVEEGSITIDGWNDSAINNIEFVAGSYTKTLSKSSIDAQAFHSLTLSNEEGETLSYNDGINERQEFVIDLKGSTNILIQSQSDTEDRIKFVNHSADDMGFKFSGNDLCIQDYKNPKILQL